jgi:hypothetical protein
MLHCARTRLAAGLVIPFVIFALASAAAGQSFRFQNVQTTLLDNTTSVGGTPLNGPMGIAVDALGNVFMADAGNHRVVKLPVGGGPPIVVDTTTQWPSPGPPAGFQLPWSVAVDPAGNLFVGDLAFGLVIEFPADPTRKGALWPIQAPVAMAADKQGHIFVASSMGNAAGIYSLSDGSLVPTLVVPVNGSVALAVDAAGNLFVAHRDQWESGLVEFYPDGNGNWQRFYIAALPTFAVNGGMPNVGLAVDAEDNIFIDDPVNGRIVRIRPDLSQFVVYFGGVSPGLIGLAVDGNDNLFQTDAINNRVFELQAQAVNFGHANVCQGATPAPCSQTLRLNYIATDQLTASSRRPAVVSLAGNGPAFSAPSTFQCQGKIPGVGYWCTVDVSFNPTAPGIAEGALNILDPHGVPQTTTFLHGIGVGPRVAFGWSTKVSLGTGLANALDVAIDAGRNLYVADYNSQSVTKIPAGGGPQTTLGTGLLHPFGVAVNGNGDVYVTDATPSLVRISKDGRNQQIIPLDGFIPGQLGGLAIDGAGNVYVADRDDPGCYVVFPNTDSCILKIPADGGGPIVAVSNLSSPLNVAVDDQGNLFIAGEGDQIVEVMAGTGTRVSLGTGLSHPFAVAVDAAHDVFIADTGNQRIVEIPGSGGPQVVVASNLGSMMGLAIDGPGNLYITSQSNSIVEFVRSQPPTLTFRDTTVGSTSIDSPQRVNLQNIGNAEWILAVPSSGFNPTLGPDFSLVGNGNCTQLTQWSLGTWGLAPGESCTYAVAFTPQRTGTLSEALTLTDNALNFNPATQMIALNGRAWPVYSPWVVITAGSTRLTYPGQTDLKVCITGGGTAIATGTVNILDGFSVLARVNVGGNGCAYWHINPGLAAGTHSIGAHYNGDAHNRAKDGWPVSVIVSPVAIHLNVYCSNSSLSYGKDVACNVVTYSNAGAPQGSVSYGFDNGVTGSVRLVNGNGVFTWAKPAAGAHRITLNYAQQTNFAAAGPVTFDFTVTPAPVNVRLIPSSWWQPAGNRITFTATVTSWSAGAPSKIGTVTFKDGNTILRSVAVDSSGAASYSTNTLSAASHSITATYDGSPSFGTGSASVTVTLTR